MNPRLRPVLFVGAFLACVGGFYAVRWMQEAGAKAEARAAAITEAEAILADGSADKDPSRVVARLLELGEEDSEARLLTARIELLRARHDRAMDRLRPLLEEGASEDALRAGFEAWSLHADSAGGDAATQRALWAEALGFAERAAKATGSARDWFCCWRAAANLEDADAAQQALSALQAEDAQSLEARTAAMLVAAGKADAPPSLEAVRALVADWGQPPIELKMLDCALSLAQNELDRALQLADAALRTAPARFQARNLAATVHHAAVLLSPEGPERKRHAALRDAQIEWLDSRAEAGDSRRSQWLAWKQVR